MAPGCGRGGWELQVLMAAAAALAVLVPRRTAAALAVLVPRRLVARRLS